MKNVSNLSIPKRKKTKKENKHNNPEKELKSEKHFSLSWCSRETGHPTSPFLPPQSPFMVLPLYLLINTHN